MKKASFAALAAYLTIGTVELHAGMGTIANTFGLLPGDVASAQASSLFSDEASATYYNPAALAQTEITQFTPGYLYASPELRIKSLGGSNPPVRTGSVVEDETNNQVILALKLYLNNISTVDNNVAWGMIAALEDDGKTLLDLEDETSREGQFMQYGERPIFVATSFGYEYKPGIYLGLGLRINLQTTATFTVESDLQGRTSKERISPQGSTSSSFITGILLDLGKIFCEKDDPTLCGPGLKLAASYRHESFYSLDIKANAVVDQVIPEPGLNFNISALDTYMPTIISVGARYPFSDNWMFDVVLEHQSWSDLSDELEVNGGGDGVADQANLRFRDILVPRFAVTYYGLNEMLDVNEDDSLSLAFGFAKEKSSLKDGLSPDVNLVDNDRLVFAIGARYDYGHSSLLNNPLSLTLSYQYHLLDARKFQLSESEAPDEPYETIEADGEVSIISAGVNLRF